MASYLTAVITAIGAWGYLIVFFGMIIEGDIVLFTSFFFANNGGFDVWKLLAVVFPGVLIGDLMWYWLGIKIDKTRSKFLQHAEAVAAPFDEHLISRTFHTIFIAKFTYGLHHAILLRAGMLRFPLRRFVGYDFITTVVWMTIVGGLGYFSGFYFSLIKNYIKFAEIGLLIGVALFIGISYYISKRSKEIL